MIDLRLPLGILFSTLGVVLMVVGILTPAAQYERSLGIDINLWWGAALFVFGIVMLAVSVIGRRRAR